MSRKFFVALTIIAVILTSFCVGDKKPLPEQEILPLQTDKAESLFDGIDGIIADTLNDGTEYAVYPAYPTKSAEPFV